MGGGPYFDKIVAYAADQGVSDDITFTGRADNDTICRVLSNADLAIDPCPDSPHANLSTATKIMEYMFFSLPIVAFDLLETRRSGDDAVCYARINNEAHFTQLIVDLLQDDKRRAELGKAAKLRLESALSWRVSSRNLVALMDGLVGTAPAPAHDSITLEELTFGQGQEAVSAEMQSKVDVRPGS
jgi:glycosyltransferase involved in cell wall biosynthesis